MRGSSQTDRHPEASTEHEQAPNQKQHPGSRPVMTGIVAMAGKNERNNQNYLENVTDARFAVLAALGVVMVLITSIRISRDPSCAF